MLCIYKIQCIFLAADNCTTTAAVRCWNVFVISIEMSIH